MSCKQVRRHAGTHAPPGSRINTRQQQQRLEANWRDIFARFTANPPLGSSHVNAPHTPTHTRALSVIRELRNRSNRAANKLRHAASRRPSIMPPRPAAGGLIRSPTARVCWRARACVRLTLHQSTPTTHPAGTTASLSLTLADLAQTTAHFVPNGKSVAFR